MGWTGVLIPIRDRSKNMKNIVIQKNNNLPISMVLRSKGSLKLEMLSLVRTSKYVDNTTNVLSINKTEEDS